MELRLAQHQNGEGCKYTADRRPVELVYCTEFPSIREAFEREHQVKGWRREKKEALIWGDYAVLPNLAKAYGHATAPTSCKMLTKSWSP